MADATKIRKPLPLFRLGAAATAAWACWAGPPHVSGAAQPGSHAAYSCDVTPAAPGTVKRTAQDPRRRTSKPVPPIDAAVPARVETATFALG